MSRIWGRSVKYALWSISRERCVIMNGNVKTKATMRLVFTDVKKLTDTGLVKVTDHLNIELTDLGYASIPPALSPSAHAAAMKFFLPGVPYVLDDQHCRRKDQLHGKASRYVTEMLLAKGVLEQADDFSPIYLAEVSPRMSWKLALWTLSNEPCYIENDTLRAKSDGRVVFADSVMLEQNGYMDRHAQITDVGRRLIPKRMGEATVKSALAVFSERPGRWCYRGHFAVGENGGRLPRYTVERLVAIGKLQIDTGGYITVPEARQRIQLDVTASELEAIKRCITSPVTLIRPPATV